MYTIDGEIIENIDDIEDDCFLLLLSSTRDKFIGLRNEKDGLSIKELRMDNAIIVKKKYDKLNKNWIDRKYLEWIEKVTSKFEIDNLESALNRHSKNEYLTKNDEY